MFDKPSSSHCSFESPTKEDDLLDKKSMLSDDRDDMLDEKPLLPDVRDDRAEHDCPRGLTGYWYRLSWRRKALAHLLVLVTYSAIFLSVLAVAAGSAEQTSDRSLLFGRGAIRLEMRRITTPLVDNPFVGDPRAELDMAWHELLKHSSFKVPFEDLEQQNLRSIELADGSAEIASFGVYHALHCLKKVKQWLHKDHYYPNASTAKLFKQSRHVDHCIEYIRESLMCKPDISPVIFKWVNDTSRDGSLGPTHGHPVMHECANWGHLDRWAGERVFDLYRLDLLRKPD